MADLGSKKISSNYQKLLQKDENGMVADGSGSLITLNLSGSEYYASGSDSADDVDVLKALTVTGSIIPEGSGSWDLGSEDSPFRHLYVTEESVHFVSNTKDIITGKPQVTRWTKKDVEDILGGEVKQKISKVDKTRLITPISTNIKVTGVEPFMWDSEKDLVSNDLTSLHIVSDKFWLWNSDLNELEPKSIMFTYASDAAPTNDLVIGG